MITKQQKQAIKFSRVAKRTGGMINGKTERQWLEEAYPPTPELNKLKMVSDKSQTIGEFVDVFLREKGIYLCRYREQWNNGLLAYRWKEGVKKAKLDGCKTSDRPPNRKDVFNDDAERNPEFECWEDGFYEASEPIRKLLAEFFEIDEAKCEQQRRAILEYHRYVQETA